MTTMNNTPIYTNDLNGNSHNLIDDNIDKLQQIFPHVVSEGKIDFDALKQVLGGVIDTEHNYTFTWHGKRQAERSAYTPSRASLLPVKNESKNWDTTGNMVIEGDNLEVLKLLQKSYANKIKMIYIDPPYNTGNDFIYHDNYKDTLKNYLVSTGQIADNGGYTNTNKETTGRKHTNWLNMIYPRLLLARNLLRDDGVIFISIDDNEQANLKKVCDEVFGEENFVANMIWNSKITGGHDSNNINSVHEYVLVYCKNMNNSSVINRYISNTKYPEIDEKTGLRFKWDSLWTVSHGYTKNCDYPIISPEGQKIFPYMCHKDGKLVKGVARWYWSKETYEQKKDDILIKNGKVYKKVFTGTLIAPNSMVFSAKIVGGTSKGKQSIRELFGQDGFFNNPKSPLLIKEILQLSTQQNDVILDFFAGSGTTAHAVMALNAQDGGKRTCISVQLPELTDEKSEAYKAGYTNIAEITKERIRRAGQNIPPPPAMAAVDTGFRVFKLAESNIKPWQADFDSIDQDLVDNINNLVAGRSDDDIVTEITLKYGLSLSENIEPHTHKDTTYYTVKGTGGIAKVFVCLQADITIDIIECILNEPDKSYPNIKVVFADRCFDNADKATVYHTLHDAGIGGISFL